MATVGTIMTITDLSGNTYNIHGMLYGQCDTAAATQAKTVAIPGITNLATGLSIRVRFVYAQLYNGVPTLNVNNLGAKNIRRSSASNAAIYEWVANEILDLVYDGTYWVIVNGGKVSCTELISVPNVTTGTTYTFPDSIKNSKIVVISFRRYGYFASITAPYFALNNGANTGTIVWADNGNRYVKFKVDGDVLTILNEGLGSPTMEIMGIM